jgi:hypothetical protein
MRYYPGLNNLNIPEMTLWQFAGSVRNIGYLESQGNKERSSAENALGISGQPASAKDIRALARQINPDLVIPED